METDELIWNVKKDAVKKRIQEGKRKDNRGLMESREIEITPEYIGIAEGSSYIKLGDTKVLAGVKLDVGEPFPDQPGKGALFTSCELHPVASPSFETGPPREETIELGRVVDRGIRESDMIDLEDLCIEPGEKVWKVFLDIYPLDQDGNLIDASAIASVSALKNADIPKYEDGEVIRGEYARELPTEDTPVANTFSKIDGETVLDPDLEEEKSQDSRITVYVDDQDNVCATQKGGKGSFKRDEINKLIKEATSQAPKVREKILNAE